ncbi:hypothetical protein C8R45DRAFT_989588 [Mycena sanguinolenta]|nr:hypothetical protein C8R45DRAFT_989588 [Mycena sanguinolenta]
MTGPRFARMREVTWSFGLVCLQPVHGSAQYSIRHCAPSHLRHHARQAMAAGDASVGDDRGVRMHENIYVISGFRLRRPLWEFLTSIPLNHPPRPSGPTLSPSGHGCHA